MNNPVAVMDLGTNTFHLLIAQPNAQNFFTEVLHDYVAVKLGEGGIQEGVIKPEAYQRGLDAMQRFHIQMQQHGVTSMRAIATSAMRNAANGPQFMEDVASRTGIHIETITGDTEAGYIYQGVKSSGCMPADDTSLIMDIGGGSVEFILGNQQQVIWKQSFEIGAARLMHRFHQTDPMPQSAVQELYDYLDSALRDLFIAVAAYPTTCLIGSSGAFETFACLVELQKGNPFDLKAFQSYRFNSTELLTITQQLIQSSHAERAAMPGIIPVRVDMIVVASVITQFIIDRLNIKNVVMSTYALKEGVLAELFKQ
ncbi:Ppx/GppA family phosphatase [Mucilaginibacter sp. Bleaf8]|uniref:Ppx/GppA phosphatase family protein n=1 Tax=Mucilaginibacter sp. Bleaf8 TaxID=2834430 RepID=UPI001BCDBFA2|nr:Ppx/GppA phosphatase family protein [Mucilaginibacter sp. Bleaf8]MBS7564984.1 Ppx/GppA family phosphatase [Mucilaginibacter sp. Bleaf8]